MASRAPHVRPAEPHSAERRLRPVYDLLDCGSNKKALQEVDRVLKKWPRLQCARALKSLATLRLGREAEALALADALKAELPTDDSTLLVMTIVYRETHRLDDVCRMYEAAVAKEPQGEDLHAQLFMAHARAGDFERQHRSAMTLYRLRPKTPYYFWGVASVVLQATRGAGRLDPAKRSVLLSLAERMIDKANAEGRLEGEQEVLFYVSVLRAQGKLAEALRFVEGPFGERLSPGELPRLKIALLGELGETVRLRDHCEELLRAEPDAWDRWTAYFDAALAPPADPDSLGRCAEFVSEMIALRDRGGPRLRGPRLARLELRERTGRTGLVDLVADYFETFGSKACVVGDLRPYLRSADADQREELARRFAQEVDRPPTGTPSDADLMQRRICAAQLARICERRRGPSAERTKSLIDSLVSLYERASLDAPKNSTERGPHDPYALLAAHYCYDLALDRNSSEPLLDALHLLESAVRSSPSNFHCKLLCIKFYHMIGCANAAHSIYESLDVKHVQLDSMGYVHVSLLGATGLHEVTSFMYDVTNKFFAHTFKDSIDHVTYSYKYGSFMKLQELMDWRERLHGSLQRALVLVEKLVLSTVMSWTHAGSLRLLSQASLSSPENVILWDSLWDNRDLGVFTDWDSLDVEDPDAASKQFQQDKSYVRIKFLLLQSMVCCANISIWATEKTDIDVQRQVEELESSSRLLDELFQKLQREKLEPVDRFSVTSPLPSRLLGFINSQMPFREIYRRAFSIVTYFYKNDSDSAHKNIQECKISIENCLRHVCDILDRQITADDPLWTCRSTLENVMNFIEVLSVTSFICGVCNDILKQPNSKKTKKKGSTVHIENSPAEPIAILLGYLSSCVDALAEKFNCWVFPQTFKDLSDRFSDLCSLTDNQRNVVTNKVKENHVITVNSLKHIMKEKQKYIVSIKTPNVRISPPGGVYTLL